MFYTSENHVIGALKMKDAQCGVVVQITMPLARCRMISSTVAFFRRKVQF